MTKAEREKWDRLAAKALRHFVERREAELRGAKLSVVNLRKARTAKAVRAA